MKKAEKNTNKGFTLIELLVVVAIIAVLAAISVVALNNARARARDAKRLADIKQIQTALELYFLDNDTYPDYGTGYTSIEGKCLSSATNGFSDTCGDTVYMAKVPAAPTPADGSCDATSNSYYYSYVNAKKYCLRYCLGSDSGGVSAGVNTATPEGVWGGTCP